MPTESTKLSLSATSFLACSLGWLLTYAGWVFYISVTSVDPGGQDLLVIGSWSAYFGVFIWLCLYLPYALRLSHGPSWLYRLPGSVFVGIIIVLLGYFGSHVLMYCSIADLKGCLQGFLFRETGWFPLFAVSGGALTGLLFPLLLLVLQRLRSYATWEWPTVMAFVFVHGTLWVLTIVLWPTFKEHYPSKAYRYANIAEQQEIYVQVLATTRVGDTLEALREKLPQKFPPNFREDRGFVDRQFYSIEVKEGVVNSVHVDPMPEPRPSPTHLKYIFPEGFTGWAYVCYATPGAAPLPIEWGDMIIEFPASGLVVTSTPPASGGTSIQLFRVGPGGPHRLMRIPKGDEVGIVTQHFGTPMSYAKNRTTTLRLVDEIFIGTNAQIKLAPRPRNDKQRCPPGIVRSY